MKRIISLLLALAMIFGAAAFVFADNTVSRGELAVMLVDSSKYKDEAKGNAQFNVFTDVSKTSANAQSIYIASRQGWMLGYTDGSFRPNNSLKLEEVCCAVFKYLGFNSKELRGAFPEAYVERAKTLEYLKGINAQLGDYVTPAECKTILHNAGIGDYKSDGSYIGIVTSYVKGINADDASAEATVSIIDTEGMARSFSVSGGSSFAIGDLISANVAASKAKVSKLSEKHILGKVNSKLTRLGDEVLASDINVLDTDKYGNVKTIDVQKLSGITLSESDVRYYTMNSKGEIDGLILNDVSGDLWSYAYLLSSSVNEATINLSSVYSYLQNGKPVTKQFSGKAFIAEPGGIGVKSSPIGTVETIKPLTEIKLDSINVNTAASGVKQFNVDENVQVYVKSSDNYYLSTIDAVNSSSYKNILGYYDTFGKGLIRVVLCY